MQKQIKHIAIGFLLAFITVFAIEHFGNFQYTNYGLEGKEFLSGYTTPFKTFVNLYTGCYPSHSNSIPANYFEKAGLYLSAVFKDFKYVIIIFILYVSMIKLTSLKIYEKKRTT